MTLVRFSPNCEMDLAIPPEYQNLHEAPADISAFWDKMTPAMLEVINQHPSGKLAMFGQWWNGYTMNRAPPELYDESKGPYAEWFLRLLFDFITGPGKFPI